MRGIILFLTIVVSGFHLDKSELLSICRKALSSVCRVPVNPGDGITFAINQMSDQCSPGNYLYYDSYSMTHIYPSESKCNL